jgi:hypothetical protein
MHPLKLHINGHNAYNYILNSPSVRPESKIREKNITRENVCAVTLDTNKRRRKLLKNFRQLVTLLMLQEMDAIA